MTTRPRPPSLSPTGTARAHFLGGASTAEPPEALGVGLRETLATRDVPDSTLLAAWEAAGWAAHAPEAQRRALGCLVVALLEASAAGGTYLPLGASLSPALARLGLSAGDRQQAVVLAGQLLDGGTPAALEGLFGGPGARRPFIVADEGLYTERWWSLEDHLVRTLRSRLGVQPGGGESRGRGKGNDVGDGDDHGDGSDDDHGPPPPALAFPPGSIDRALATLDADVSGRIVPTAEQIAAVRAALTQPLTVIAGGPGTGKTSIVVTLLRTLARLDIPMDRIALAASTGRAARRIKESVDAALARVSPLGPGDVDLSTRFPDALTLHRLLGIRAARVNALEAEAPHFHERWRLPHQFVIVDEASMIDLVLMDQLMSAVAPGARLILLGDADQLPSVEVGAVFRELVAATPARACRLARSHRMNPGHPAGAEILAAAGSVNTGADHVLALPVHDHAADLRFTGFERLAAPAVGELLERWHDDILGGEGNLLRALGHIVGRDPGADAALVGRLLQTHARSRILCVTRTAGRRSSVLAVNATLHAKLQAAALARGAGDALARGAYLPGEPVMMLRNDYARGLSNGDLGVIVRLARSAATGGGHASGGVGDGGAAEGVTLGIAFLPDANDDAGPAPVVYPLEELLVDVTLAFALTVHKAQGSEYDRVALILPEVDVPLLSREVLYTALTRARDAVVVVGDPALFATGVQRNSTRPSAIARKLAVPPAPATL